MVGRVTNFSPAGLTITAPKLISLKESVKSAYQRNGGWMFSRQTRALIRALTATASRPGLLVATGYCAGHTSASAWRPCLRIARLGQPCQHRSVHGQTSSGYCTVTSDAVTRLSKKTTTTSCATNRPAQAKQLLSCTTTNSIRAKLRVAKRLLNLK
jgi:hypothetical protein